MGPLWVYNVKNTHLKKKIIFFKKIDDIFRSCIGEGVNV